MPQKKKPAPEKFEQFTIELTDPDEVRLILPLLKAELLNPTPGPRIDVLKVRWPSETQITLQTPDGTGTPTVLQATEIEGPIIESPFAVTFYPHENGVACILDNQAVAFNRPAEDTERTRQRNAALNIKIPPIKKPGAKWRREMAQPLQNAEITQVPNDPANVLFGEAIARLGSWKTNEHECFKYAQNGTSIVSFHIDEEIPDAFSEQLLQTLDTRFTAMKGDLVADVADILFWHWYANKRPAYAEITLSQILEYRRKIEPGPDTIKEHWQAMRDIRSIKLRGDGIESESLFHISAAQFSEANATSLKTIYRYHPGYFLSEAIQKDAFYIAYFARSVWQLDYFRDAYAKRLARVLRAEWRRNPASYLPAAHPLVQTPRYRTWAMLLSDAGIDYENGIAKTEPTRFIKAIESELEKLYSRAEFIRECAPACYHSDDRKKRENLPRYNSLKTWLSLRTHIAPAADITDLLAQTTTRRLALQAQQKAFTEGKSARTRGQKKAG